MRKCGKKMPLAKNGEERGTCTGTAGHTCPCGNETCSHCAIVLTKKNATLSNRNKFDKYCGYCRDCRRDYHRKKYGQVPLNKQIPGNFHRFPCSCEGTLPDKHGESNRFAKWHSRTWTCRITSILNSSIRTAKIGGYKSIDPNIPHSEIRQKMQEPNCVICHDLLDWAVVGYGKTPHLHHNHETRKIYGFSHIRCNPLATERRILELEALLKAARNEVSKFTKPKRSHQQRTSDSNQDERRFPATSALHQME